MRPIRRSVWLLAGWVATGFVLAAELSPRDIVERSFKAYNKHDADAIASLFDPDAALWRLGEEKPVVSGRDGLRQFFLDQFRDHPEAKSKAANWIEMGPWIGLREKTILEPGEPARDTLVIFEVLGGKIRRVWTMKGEAEDGGSGGGEGPVALSIEKWNEGDLPRLMATYDEGATISLLSTGERLAAGEEALRDRFEKAFEGGPRRAEVLQRMSLPPWVVYRERGGQGSENGSAESIVVYKVLDNLIRRVWIAR